MPRTRDLLDAVAALLSLATVVGLVLAFPALAAAANPTRLSINCTPKQLSPGTESSCVATVTDAGTIASRQPPSGTVTFTVEGVGALEPDNACSLEPAGAFSSKCTLGYRPTEIAGGEHTLLGTYDGDEGHARATARVALEVTPVNDMPDNATRLPIPARVSGTTEGATWEWEDPELCSDAYAPVWYSVKPARDGRLAIRLTVRGRVDSVAAVFRLDRSKQSRLGCELTDASGVAGVTFDAERGMTYLIAVAAPWDAREGGFTLETASVAPLVLPGVRVRRDADVRLDPLLRPGIAFSLDLPKGITYRANAIAPGVCLQLSLLPPGARSIDDAVRRSTGCSGYLLFTRGEGGRGSFSLVVSVPAGRAVPVHVSLRTASSDDLAPGLSLADGRRRPGRLSARAADVVDVYRVRASATSDATFVLSGQVHADLVLLSSSGRRMRCECDGRRSTKMVQRLTPGTYFVAVHGRPGVTGAYAISLRMRRPTSTTVRIGRASESRKARPVVARVSPATGSGRVVFEIERFDPLSGWHFHHGLTRRVHGAESRASISGGEGRWRVRATYAGSLSWSKSGSSWVQFVVGSAR